MTQNFNIHSQMRKTLWSSSIDKKRHWLLDSISLICNLLVTLNQNHIDSSIKWRGSQSYKVSVTLLGQKDVKFFIQCQKYIFVRHRFHISNVLANCEYLEFSMAKKITKKIWQIYIFLTFLGSRNGMNSSKCLTTVDDAKSHSLALLLNVITTFLAHRAWCTNCVDRNRYKCLYLEREINHELAAGIYLHDST